MRYYNFVLNSNEELIKEKATIKLRDYGYGSTLQSLNAYLHQKMKNDICFFAYREDEGNAISAVFSFNERKYSLRDSYYYIMEMLREAFRIKRIKEEPCEITMYQFMECLDEAKRREYVMFGNGKKILCRGNHDKQYDQSLFEGIYDFLQIHVDGINISLMHYPMMEWPKSRHGSIHLHGHMHNYIDYNLKQRLDGYRRYDVGVDANNYCPVSLDDIKNFFMI